MTDNARSLEEMFDVVDEETPPSTEYVPHKNGRIRADRSVVVSLRVTAKERYLWSLEVAKRGTTVTDIVRAAFNRLLEEGRDDD